MVHLQLASDSKGIL